VVIIIPVLIVIPRPCDQPGLLQGRVIIQPVA